MKHPPALPLPAVIIDGAPWFHLRDILKATDHRPFFIRNSLLPMEGLRNFLASSDKPLARRMLAGINAHADAAEDRTGPALMHWPA